MSVIKKKFSKSKLSYKNNIRKSKNKIIKKANKKKQSSIKKGKKNGGFIRSGSPQHFYSSFDCETSKN